MAKIQVRIILEILGRPAAHVTEALQQLATKIGSEKGVKVLEQTLHEPVSVKDSKDLYTTFGEFVLELDSINVLFNIIFGYMPAHAEIISPENFDMPNADLSTLVNALLQRLHNYDAIAKRLVVDKDMLTQKLFEVAPHLFKRQGEEQQQVQAQPQTQESKTKKKSSKSKKSSRKK